MINLEMLARRAINRTRSLRSTFYRHGAPGAHGAMLADRDQTSVAEVGKRAGRMSGEKQRIERVTDAAWPGGIDRQKGGSD